MAYTFTFNDIVPPSRSDGQPWTHVKIEEANAQNGPWALIDTLELDPVDNDAENPKLRNFTTNSATLLNGWYRLTAVDAGENSEIFLTRLNDPEQVLPTVREVARFAITRTRTAGGTLAGTYNEQTAPLTPQVVQGFIHDARDEVYGIVGRSRDVNAAAIRSAIALVAALKIEVSFSNEQTGDANNRYERLSDQWDATRADIVAAVGTDGAADEQGSRMGVFGVDGCLRVGMNTPW